MKGTYIDALCKELIIRKDYLGGEPIETIYFGGGTPSQLDRKDFEKVFNIIYKNFHVIENPEITVEANPDDITTDYLKGLSQLPFNRISMGVQTFDDDTLRLLNRRHTAKQAIEAFQKCREANFKNISIDLIYGLPGETLEKWDKDLALALKLRPEHISAYHLIYEEGTALWKLREQHQIREVDEDTSVNLFQRLIDTLKAAGYIHYEISNFCLPTYHSLHNTSYWQGKKYLGCGPSAHSYNLVSRQWNIASLNKYIEGINREENISEIEELDLYTRYNERIITNIRTFWGMPLESLKNDFGQDLYNYCMKMARPHLDAHTLEIKDGVLKLTEKGIFTSDGIMSDLFWVD